MGSLSFAFCFFISSSFQCQFQFDLCCGSGNSMESLLKHFIVLFFGFGLMYALHKIPYGYFKGISILALPLIILLIYTATQGNLIAGANANRWIRIPIVGLSFQTSTLASIVLLAYVANLMSKDNPKLYRQNPPSCQLGCLFYSDITDFACQLLDFCIVVFYGAYLGFFGRVSHQVSFGDVGYGVFYGHAVCIDCQGLSRLGSQ